MENLHPAKRTVLWQRMKSEGLEFCEIEPTRAGWQIAGTALAQLDGIPTRVQYQVVCDGDWQTQMVAVTQWRDGASRSLALTRDVTDHWRVNGDQVPALTGCKDIDLGITPATNTLPIRRLVLAVGARAAVTAAWVRFPALTVAPLAQHYTRLAAQRYRYESTNFATEITVDDWGVAVQYEGGWERIG